MYTTDCWFLFTRKRSRKLSILEVSGGHGSWYCRIFGSAAATPIREMTSECLSSNTKWDFWELFKHCDIPTKPFVPKLNVLLSATEQEGEWLKATKTTIIHHLRTMNLTITPAQNPLLPIFPLSPHNSHLPKKEGFFLCFTFSRSNERL